MASLFITSRGKTSQYTPLKLQCIRLREGRVLGLKAHDATNRIASIHDGSGTENNLSGLKGKRIYIYDILDVATSENGCIHTHPIYGVNQTVCGKTANHGTSSSLLAFLDKDLSACLKQVCRGLRIFKQVVGLRDSGDGCRHLALFIPKSGSRNNNLFQIQLRGFHGQAKLRHFKLVVS